MRNLEDCKTEVFRRSEERIKKRKRNRNRVLACCIPLCLLLVAGGIYIRPLFEPKDEVGEFKAGDTGKINEEMGGVDYELRVLSGTVVNCTAAEITDGTGDEVVTRRITDARGIKELCLAVGKYYGITVAEEALADGAEEILPESIVMGNTTGSGNNSPAGEKESEQAADVTEQTTAGSDIDTSIAEEIKLKYGLEDKPADYKLVFYIEEGNELVFRLCGNALYDDKNDCMIKLSDAQLAELKLQIEAVAGDRSNDK